MDRRFWLGFAAYVLPSFPIAYVWHLVAFEARYQTLQIYRDDVIVPFGLASMLIQGAIFSWWYGKAFAPSPPSWRQSGLRFGGVAALLSWSFTTLAVAAKHPMASIPDFLALETAFTVVQFAVVGPLMALAWRAGR